MATDLLFSSSSLLGSQVWDWKFQASNHMPGSIGNRPPFLGGIQKSLHYQKDTIIVLIT